MHSQFRKNILPRAIPSLQSMDDSVERMMVNLKSMCNGPSLLTKVQYQIEQDLTSVTLGMKVADLKDHNYTIKNTFLKLDLSPCDL